MSNVTAQEIIRFTARAFGQSFSATMQPGFTGLGYRVAKPWTRSRNVALLLIQRHTDLDWREIARIFDFGVHSIGSQLIRKISERTDAEARLHPALAVKLEQIESEIDALHDARCEPEQPASRAAVLNAWLHGSRAAALDAMLIGNAEAVLGKAQAGPTHAH
jgi:hypothetical protein